MQLKPKQIVSSKIVCAAACLELKACVAFSFSDANGNCVLSESSSSSVLLTATAFHNKFITYKRVAPGCTLTPTVCADTFDAGTTGKLNGSKQLGEKLTEQTEASCAASCLTKSQCIAFSHAASIGQCHLSKSAADEDVLASGAFQNRFMSYKRVPSPCSTTPMRTTTTSTTPELAADSNPCKCPDGSAMYVACTHVLSSCCALF